MAPLHKALEVTVQPESKEGHSLYGCKLDGDWTIGAVPLGGYVLGVIVEACIRHQAGSAHVDPVHLSAHFLRATNTGKAGVRVALVKTGKTFTNLQAELVQQGITKITAHLIFGDLSPGSSAPSYTLAPPSPYARRLPLHCHPYAATPDYIERPFRFKSKMQWAVDKTILARNNPDSRTRSSDTVGGGGVEWGAWCELRSEDDVLRTSSIPFFADVFMDLPVLLPDSEPVRRRAANSWFPTITMTIEFKTRIPSSSAFSNRAVGIYCESRFLHDPQARHNARVEVWTAPSCIGQGEEVSGWRDRQYCIAVADQVALMVPMDLNQKEGKRDRTKL